MSSHAIHQGTLSHSHLSLLSHCALILAKGVEYVSTLKKKKKKVQVENELLNILRKSCLIRKKATITTIASYARVKLQT